MGENAIRVKTFDLNVDFKVIDGQLRKLAIELFSEPSDEARVR